MTGWHVTGCAVFFALVSCTAGANRVLAQDVEFRGARDRLTRVEQLVGTADGGAWAIDSRTAGLVRLHPSGEMTVVGNEGEGPGEFSRPWRLTLVRDTLWVADIGLDRLSAYDPKDGAFLASISGFNLWRTVPLSDDQSIAPLGISATGSVVAAIDEPASGTVLIAELARGWPASMTELARLDRRGNDLHIPTPGGGTPIKITNPFSNADLLTVDNAGGFVGLIHQNPGTEVRLVALRPGSDDILYRSQRARRKITRSEVDSWMASSGWPATFTARGIFPSEGAARAAIEEAVETDVIPVVRRLTRGVFERGTFIDRSGGVWFEAWSIDGPTREWLRWSGDEPTLQFALGRDEILLEVDRGFAWIQGFDENRVPSLRRRRIGA